MTCPLCKGKMNHGSTIVPYELGQDRVVVVSKVPARICGQCGEIFIEMSVVRELEGMIEKTLADGVTFGIVEYGKAA